MMSDIVLGVSLPFQTPADRAASEKILLDLLGATSLVNLRYLDAHPETPRLYDSGIAYTPPDQATRPPLDPADLAALRQLLSRMRQEPEVQDLIERILRGVEIFLDVPSLYARGKGDCNELAPVRIAELWQAGIDASPHLIKDRGLGGSWTYHAAVLHPDGSSEDPSRILGMGDPRLRLEEIRKNTERYVGHMALGVEVCNASGYAPEVLGQQMNLAGYLPRDGVFRVGGPPVDLLGWARRQAQIGARRRHRDGSAPVDLAAWRARRARDFEEELRLGRAA